VRHEELIDMIPAAAAGALTSEETRMLDEHLAGCESCRREHAAHLEAAALAALAVDPVTPPADVRRRVMAEIDGTRSATPVAEFRPRRTPAWWLAAAGLILAAGIGAWAWTETRQKQQNIEALRRQLLASQRESAEAAQREAELARKLEVLTSGETASIRMAGQEVAPEASASVFMNREKRSALVFFNHLPPTAPDKSYQLWVIRGDMPEPQSAGTFEVGADGKATLGVANLPVNTEIKAFALTLEPRGGGKAPTGPKFLIGG
jgi:hypothetical protein